MGKRERERERGERERREGKREMEEDLKRIFKKRVIKSSFS